jgi:hypothetical protein
MIDLLKWLVVNLRLSGTHTSSKWFQLARNARDCLSLYVVVILIVVVVARLCIS